MFSVKQLELDAPREVERITAWLKATVAGPLRKRGVVLGLSGGVDSSVCLALAVRALGPERVLGLLMPERDSEPAALTRGQQVADQFGVDRLVEDLTPALEALGCYRRRDAAIRSLLPDYGPGCRSKIVLPPLQPDGERLNVFFLVARWPDGAERTVRLPTRQYLEVVAATSMKQRTRKALEYHHADRLRYAVLGTPNRLEHDQGFFVRQGDGAADLMPIAHLYKTQVYQLARHFELPTAICDAAPATDTYTLPQTQEEFYFRLPFWQLDLLLYALDHGIAADEAGAATGLGLADVEQAWRDIRAKRRTTAVAHLPPLLCSPVEGVRQAVRELLEES